LTLVVVSWFLYFGFYDTCWLVKPIATHDQETRRQDGYSRQDLIIGMLLPFNYKGRKERVLAKHTCFMPGRFRIPPRIPPGILRTKHNVVLALLPTSLPYQTDILEC